MNGATWLRSRVAIAGLMQAPELSYRNGFGQTFDKNEDDRECSTYGDTPGALADCLGDALASLPERQAICRVRDEI